MTQVQQKFDVWDNSFSEGVFKDRYSHGGKETWNDVAERVGRVVTEPYLPKDTQDKIIKLIADRKFIPGGRYLYSAGRPYHQVNNCVLFRAEDSREGWAELQYRVSMSLMTGAGVGVDYSLVRPEGAIIARTGGTATGPGALMNIINETGRYVMQGGQRRSAIWAGLAWWHPDVFKFMESKNRTDEQKERKAADWVGTKLDMELTNISVIYDALFFAAVQHPEADVETLFTIAAKEDPNIWELYDLVGPDSHIKAFEYLNYDHAMKVWLQNCRQAFETAEPGMSMNPNNWKESLRNACTEVTSEDDSDKCNLGTVWMNRHEDIDDFENTVNLATQFLICGGLYSDVPTERIREVGLKNNRIGLGLGGMHDWLMTRGATYEVIDEMHDWLQVYEDTSDSVADFTADQLGVARPKGKRAIAPTGTIGILAETTTGIEPLFCASYIRRRWAAGSKIQNEYVVDATVKRLMDKGVPIEDIKDTYDLTFEQRVKFQADVQDYVDMAISSTCNMAQWGSEANNESNVEDKAYLLLEYAPRLRGFTVYPDGCMSGQPLTKVNLKEALLYEGMVFEDREDMCVGGSCGV